MVLKKTSKMYKKYGRIDIQTYGQTVAGQVVIRRKSLELSA